MLSALPDPDPAVLATPPAQIVTFSLAIEAERKLKPSDGVAWQRALDPRGFSPSTLRKVHQQTVTVQAGAPLAVASGERSEAWQLQQRDLAKTATLSETSCTLERSRYPGFEIFASEVRTVCESFRDIFSPALRNRVALRYSNALSQAEATSPHFWKDKVADSFLSIAADDRFDHLARTFSIVELHDGSAGVQVRSGIQPDAVYKGAFAFVFDIESSDSSLTTFDVDAVLEVLVALNRTARQMFQTVLTNEYFTVLKSDTP